MVTNTKRLLLAIIILVGFSSFLSAQNANYFSVTEGGQTRFYQRLSWSGGEYALRYEVVIERSVEGRYIAHLRDFTTSLFIVVSLPPGEYRFRVIPYDILNRPVGGSQWVNIEVHHALRPELMGMLSGFYSSGIDDQRSGYVLKVAGNDIVPGAEIFIRHPDGALVPSEVLSYGYGADVVIFVDSDKTAPGEYELLIRNPGGLESSISGIVLKEPPSESVYRPEPERVAVVEPEPEPEAEEEPEQEPVEKSGLAFDPLGTTLINFGLVWAPVWPVHGVFYGTEFSPLGFGIYLSTVFSVPMFYIGPELAGFWYINDANELILTTGINLLVMKWMPNQKTAVNFRPGVSFVIMPDTEERIMVSIGTSFVWRILNKVLMEIGLDYMNLLKRTNSDGFIRPWISFGGMF